MRISSSLRCRSASSFLPPILNRDGWAFAPGLASASAGCAAAGRRTARRPRCSRAARRPARCAAAGRASRSASRPARGSTGPRAARPGRRVRPVDPAGRADRAVPAAERVGLRGLPRLSAGLTGPARLREAVPAVLRQRLQRSRLALRLARVPREAVAALMGWPCWLGCPGCPGCPGGPAGPGPAAGGRRRARRAPARGRSARASALLRVRALRRRKRGRLGLARLQLALLRPEPGRRAGRAGPLREAVRTGLARPAALLRQVRGLLLRRRLRRGQPVVGLRVVLRGCGCLGESVAAAGRGVLGPGAGLRRGVGGCGRLREAVRAGSGYAVLRLRAVLRGCLRESVAARCGVLGPRVRLRWGVLRGCGCLGEAVANGRRRARGVLLVGRPVRSGRARVGGVGGCGRLREAVRAGSGYAVLRLRVLRGRRRLRDAVLALRRALGREARPPGDQRRAYRRREVEPRVGALLRGSGGAAELRLLRRPGALRRRAGTAAAAAVRAPAARPASTAAARSAGGGTGADGGAGIAGRGRAGQRRPRSGLRGACG